MARTLDVVRSEIHWDSLQCWDEMDITLLFGINFGRIRIRWKEKFMYFAMEQCFSTGYVLEIDRKFVNMRQQWDNEELKEATTM